MSRLTRKCGQYLRSRKIPPDTRSAIAFSDFSKSGVLPFPEVTQPIFDEINEAYGTDIEPIFK